MYPVQSVLICITSTYSLLDSIICLELSKCVGIVLKTINKNDTFIFSYFNKKVRILGKKNGGYPISDWKKKHQAHAHACSNTIWKFDMLHNIDICKHGLRATMRSLPPTL